MGRTETITCNYLKDKEVFADVLNIVLYSGKKIVKAENITELDGTYMSIIPDTIEGMTDTIKNTQIRRYRDILGMVKLGDIQDESEYCVRLIAGIEQQTKVHYAMPVRNMLYDALEYMEQVKKKSEYVQGNSKERQYTRTEFLSGIGKDDRLIPVVTIVVYLQPEEWDGPRSLHEMLDFKGISEELVNLIPDYKMLILQPSDYKEVPEVSLDSTLSIVMGLLGCADSKDKFYNYINTHSDKFKNMSHDATAVINEYCDIGIPEERIREEELIDVCRAMEEIREEERIKGESQGRQIGKVIAYIDMGVSVEEIAGKLHITVGEVNKIIAQIEV